MPAAARPRTSGGRPRAGLLLAAVVAVGVWIAWSQGAPVRPGTARTRQLVVVPPGAGLGDVAALLRSHGLIRSSAFFEAYALVSGASRHLQAGTYRLSPGMSTPAMVRTIALGETAVAVVTVVPGMTVAEVAAREAALGLVPATTFLAYARTAAPPQGFPASPGVVYRLEGYLYPDTYRIPLGSSAAAVVAPMLAAFADAFGPAARAAAAREGLTPVQAVTLASIVEREASQAAVRRKVAGVFLNRLKIGMPLGSDATIYYAANVSPGGRLTSGDFQVASPYNTYRYPGLPPGPIDNPGGGALAAVLHPAHVPYLYFFARPDGTYVFSRTYAGQLAAERQATG